MRRSILIVLTIALVLSIVNSPTSLSLNVNAQNGEEIFVPQRMEFEHFFDNGFGNDIFFRTNQANAFLGHSYTSSESAYDLFSYDTITRSDLGTFNPISDSITAPDFDTLYHVSNVSSSPLDLDYEISYYDLSPKSGDEDVLMNLILLEDKMSGIRFDAQSGEALIIDFKIKSQRDIERLNVFLLSPSGETYSYAAITNSFPTFVNNFIPLIPDEAGTYTLFVSPLDDDLILQQMRILQNPPVSSITNGYTQRLQGVNTQTMFFELSGDQTGTPSILELSSSIFYNDSVSSPDTLLGKLDIRYFSGDTSPFGLSVPTVGSASLMQWKNDATYVSVTATPPQDSDPFIKAIKNDIGLPVGFDVEYAFWTEKFEIIDQFEENTDITVEIVKSPVENNYLWTTMQPHVIGLNHSAAGTATLTNLNDPINSVFLDSTANNILEVASHSPTMLKPGEYLVILTGIGDARIHILDVLNLELGDANTFVFNVDKPLLFSLPINQPIKEYFNITYTKLVRDVNASVDVNFRLYGMEFDQISSSSFLFEEYYSNPSTLVSNNNTLFGSTNVNQRYNIKQQYIKIFPTANTLYNPDGSTNGTDVATLNPTFSIARMNYLNVWQEAGADRVLQSDVYASGASFPINGTKSNIIQVYQFDTAEGYNGYSLSLSSINVSFTFHLIADWNNFWYNSVNVNTPKIVDGETAYIFDMEFGTTESTKFAIVILMTPTLDGIFTTNLQGILVQQTPEIPLGSLNLGNYEDVLIDPIDTNTNDTTEPSGTGGIVQPLLIGGGAIAIVSIGVLLLRRSGRI